MTSPSEPSPSKVGALLAFAAAAALLLFFSVQWGELQLMTKLHDVRLTTWPVLGELSASVLWFAVATPALLLLGVALARLAPGVGLKTWLALRENPERTALLLSLGAALLSLLIRTWVTLGADFTDDERTYLFQAQTLRHFGFSAPMPTPAAAFENEFVVRAVDGRAAGVFPVGQPLLFALASFLGPVWLFQPLWAAGLVWVTFALARKLTASPGVAVSAAALVMASPWLCFISGTQHNAIASAFFVALALWQAARFVERPALGAALLTGASIGTAFLVRPLDGLVVGVSVAAWWLTQLWRTRAVRSVGFMALGVGAALLVAGVQLASNATVTGHALSTPYDLWIADKWPGVHLFGFGKSIWGMVQTPASAVAKTFTVFLRIAAWQAGAPLVFLLSLAGLSLVREERAVRALAVPFALLTVGYFFYFFPSVQDFGSLYHLPLLPVLSILAALALKRLVGRVPVATVAAMALATVLVGVVTFWLPVGERTHFVAQTIVQPVELVEEASSGGQRLLVLVSTLQGPTRSSFVFRPFYPSGDAADPVLWARDVVDPKVRAELLATYPDRLPGVLKWKGPFEPVLEPAVPPAP